MARIALAGSLALHAIAAVLVLAIDHEERPRTAAPPVAIEMVAAPVPIRELPIAVPSPAGGGAIAVPAPMSSRAPARVPQRARSVPARSVRDLVGPIALDGADPIDGGDLAGDGGTGTGTGDGIGGGLGLGDGGGLVVGELPRPPAAPVAAPPRSRARPARLIYPVRQHNGDDSEMFVARITVDDEGYVAGARLVRGFDLPGSRDAEGLIFKFRYEPALDDAGHAIASTFDQGFFVGR
jgi:hypothetical protein